VIDIELALFDLAEHLDHPAGDELGAAVLGRIVTPEPGAARRRVRVLLAIAAVFVVVIASVVAIAPARHAIARWLGIGAVEVHVSDHPLPPGSLADTVPGAPGSSSAPPDRRAVQTELAAARRAVGFPIALPHNARIGELSGVALDARVQGGLVVLRYPHFTIVEIATDPQGALIGKLLDRSAHTVAVTVAGRPGLWISAAHEVGYLDRSGQFRTDTIRTSGPVLLWEGDAVTYRIEGVASMTTALSIATSVR